jgi:hypothetical protein
MVSKAITVALVLVFAFDAVSPTLFAGAGPNLPACCRRDGQHRCITQSATAEGLQLNTVRCRYFPKNATAPGGQRWVPPSSRHVTAVVFSHPAAKAQTEAYYRISLMRGSQKRGPPCLA